MHSRERDAVEQAVVRGSELLKQGKLDDAQLAFRDALVLEPENPRVLALLGLTYFRASAFSEARAVYEQLVERAPSDASHRQNLGLVYLKLNDADRAIAALEASRALDPSQGRAVSYLGLAYARAGRYAEAYRAFLIAGQTELATEIESNLTAAERDRIQDQLGRAPQAGAPDAEVDGTSAPARTATRTQPPNPAPAAAPRTGASSSPPASLLSEVTPARHQSVTVRPTGTEDEPAPEPPRVVTATGLRAAPPPSSPPVADPEPARVATATLRAAALTSPPSTDQEPLRPPPRPRTNSPDPDAARASARTTTRILAADLEPVRAAARAGIAPAAEIESARAPSPHVISRTRSPTSAPEQEPPRAPSPHVISRTRAPTNAPLADAEAPRGAPRTKPPSAPPPRARASSQPGAERADPQSAGYTDLVFDAAPAAAETADSTQFVIPRAEPLAPGHVLDGRSMISRAVASATPSPAPGPRTRTGGLPPRPLSELATDDLVRPDDGDDAFEVGPSGALIIRVTDRMLTRLDGVHATGGDLSYELAMRRSRGHSTEEAFDHGGAQLHTVTGRGYLIAVPGAQTFTAVRLDDDILYVREDLVFAFEASLRWENGNVPGLRGKLPVVQFRGDGAVVLRLARPLMRVKLPAQNMVFVDADRLAGWIGRVIPRAVVPPPGGPLGAMCVECTGEGIVLVEPGPPPTAGASRSESRRAVPPGPAAPAAPATPDPVQPDDAEADEVRLDDL